MRVWTGQFVSTIGDGMHTVAILWWVRVSTGSDALVAAIALSSAVAAVLLSPVGELQPWMICILAAGLSGLSAFFGPALGALTP